MEGKEEKSVKGVSRTFTRPFASDDERRKEFINSLKRLAVLSTVPGVGRQAMAELRGELRDTPADRYRSGRYVVEFLGKFRDDEDEWFYLVGGLFALYPQDRAGISVGNALGMLSRTMDSMDGRLLALLNTRAENLPSRLRQVVSILKAKSEAADALPGLDYELLLKHLCAWDDASNWVQKQWAHDYYFTKVPVRKTKQSSAAEVEDEIEGEDDED